MPLIPLDALDDQVLEVGTAGFAALNSSMKSTLLPDTVLSQALNSLVRADGLVGARPGLRHAGKVAAAALGSAADTQGGLFYAAEGYEALLVMRAGIVSALTSLEEPAALAVLTGATATGKTHGAQLVSHAYLTDPAGGLRWLRRNLSIWTTGAVTTDAAAATLPKFSALCTHGFRLLAAAAGTDAVYASALLQGYASADWSAATQQVRVGTGEADAIVSMISSQNGQLQVLKENSVWIMDTSASTMSQWSIARTTSRCGCAAAGSAVQIGQDTIFLSRSGVISLAALVVTDAISQAALISAPIAADLAYINWSAAATIVAEAWGSYYLLAVPIGADTAPRDIFVYDVAIKQWLGHWRMDLPATTAANAGIGAMMATHFLGLPELVLADNCGHLRHLDESCTSDELDRVDGTATTQEVGQDIITKAWTWDTPETYKSLVNLAVEFWDSDCSTAQVWIVRDGKESEQVSGTIRTSSNPGFPMGFPCAFQPDKGWKRAFSLRGFGRARELAVRITETTGALSLRSVKVSAFCDAAEVMR